jgi:hypothetical protein
MQPKDRQIKQPATAVRTGAVLGGVAKPLQTNLRPQTRAGVFSEGLASHEDRLAARLGIHCVCDHSAVAWAACQS